MPVGFVRQQPESKDALLASARKAWHFNAIPCCLRARHREPTRDAGALVDLDLSDVCYVLGKAQTTFPSERAPIAPLRLVAKQGYLTYAECQRPSPGRALRSGSGLIASSH